MVMLRSQSILALHLAIPPSRCWGSNPGLPHYKASALLSAVLFSQWQIYENLKGDITTNNINLKESRNTMKNKPAIWR